jgi:polynucleotide 5'-kinase involved in rRNA processing
MQKLLLFDQSSTPILRFRQPETTPELELKQYILSFVRVAVVGNVDSGKSTLIGVLTGGALNNGRGLARSKVFIHAN